MPIAAALTSLLTDVYAITKRPDLVAQTTNAVKAAALKAHRSDFYAKDLYETGLEFVTSAFYQDIPYKQIIPRYRAMKYLRKYDAVGDVAGAFFTIITPEQVLDSYNISREDVIYLSGDLLSIRSSTQFQFALFGCYLNPDITETGFNSWIATDQPYLIEYDAAVTIFKAIGFDEQATVYQKMVLDQYAELKMEIATKGE